MKFKRLVIWVALCALVMVPIFGVAESYLPNNMLTFTQLYTYIASKTLSGALEGKGGALYSSNEKADIYELDSVSLSVSKEHHIALKAISTEIELKDEGFSEKLMCLIIATQYGSVKDLIEDMSQKNINGESTAKWKMIEEVAMSVFLGKSVVVDGINYGCAILDGVLYLIVSRKSGE